MQIPTWQDDPGDEIQELASLLIKCIHGCGERKYIGVSRNLTAASVSDAVEKLTTNNSRRLVNAGWVGST